MGASTNRFTNRFWAGLDLSSPLVMGILNVTPDSFSGGEPDPVRAVAQARAMMEAGAAIIDIGGESTRPSAEPVPPGQEIARILPVIRPLATLGAILSIDTRNAATMAAALDAGARIVNDVSALRHDPQAAGLVARLACPVILTHMRGSPLTMACQAHYADPVADILAELAERRDAAIAAGIAPGAIVLDPGIGFAKTAEHNIMILQSLARFTELGHPILVGASRKRFIGTLAGVADPAARDPGSIACALFAIRHGAAIVRVHDVAGTVQALRVVRALELAR